MDLSFDKEQLKEEENFNVNLINYFKKALIEKEIKKIAKKIVEDFNPKTVLDCGCVGGLLVLELRKLGVEAFGISSSRAIIETVNEKAKQFCEFKSVANFNFVEKEAKSYDLVVCIQDCEFFRYLRFKDYVKNLSKLSSNVLFGFVFKDLKKEENLPLVSSIFSEVKMLRNLNYCLNFMGCCVYYFKKDEEKDFSKIIYDCEENIEKLKKDNEKLNEKVSLYSKNFVVFKKAEETIFKLAKEYREVKIRNIVLRYCEKQFEEIKSSFFWRLTFPCRFTITLIRNFIKNLKKFALFMLKILSFLLKNLKPKNFRITLNIFLKKGIIKILKVVFSRGFGATLGRSQDFVKYFRKVKPKKEELEMQKILSSNGKLVFSVVVPLYNTPRKFLVELIDSVKNQTYPKWQLCLSDGSEGEEFKYIEEYCKLCAKEDSRIFYKKIGKNLGIAENTNVALKMATGDYIALLDHDDMLSPIALFENEQVISKTGADFLYSDEMVFFEDDLESIRFLHFKPDFSPDYLCTNNYICHLSVFSAKLREEIGFFRSEFNGSQDFDYVLRLTEKAKKICHIPKLLYYWRASETSVAKDISAKPYCIEAAKRAISAHLKRTNVKGEVVSGMHYTLYRIKYEIVKKDLVTILIPNKNHILDLEKCIKSILEKSSYENFEILILENNSHRETLDYYNILKKKSDKIKVVTYDIEGFNYARLNNNGAKYAFGEYLLFLNNDIEVISPNWIEEMLMYAQRKDVGAVGAKLYYEDETIQHCGIFLSKEFVAVHSHKDFDRKVYGYASRAIIVQNVNAVTAACLMVKKSKFFEVGGFDENLEISYNDVDFCLKLREKGYLNVFTPYAELFHYESKSRGYARTPYEYAVMVYEKEYITKKWSKLFEGGDCYYNPNLNSKVGNFEVNLED